MEPMCGIVGYVGPRDSQAILLAGLARLEYRGYDSAGIAVIDDAGDLDMRKRAGKLQVLRDDLAAHPMPDGTTGIGHTRWATHGGPTDANAHPHLADDDKLAVIHNGIIENFSELKAELLSEGYTFRSETDTEVAAVLLGREYRPPATSSPRSAPSSRAWRRVHAPRDAPRPARTRRRRPPQLAARDRSRRGRELPRIRRRRLRRAHAQRPRDRAGRDRRDHPAGVEVTDFAGAPSRSSRSRSSGTPRRPRRAAGPRSWPRRSPRSPRPSRTRSAGACTTAGDHSRARRHG
jgi:glucosamine--fructose-6-phosphate aminotransferase (isomerizing)